MGATTTDPLVGRVVDGRYEVVSRIARGGMATVYLAVDRRLDREVALKVMHSHLAEGASGAAFVARFRREARTAARLAHPGLVAILDQGVDGDTSYLTMEYVDGTTLRRRLGEHGSLAVGDALRVAEDVLDALAVAHRMGLVHRDIKPENVLIASDERVKLADFGLARAITEVTSTTTGTVLGTVAYLAPELIAHGVSDTRTDVYAVGILLYEMITGRQPFTGQTPAHIAFQHVNSDIPAPSEAVAWLPAEVDDLVRALAARDPDERPAEAGSALALLRRTRTALDATVLGRRADVPPTGVTDLPEADPADDPDDSLAEGSGDPGATARLDRHGAGSTIALPIGTGLPESALAQDVPHRHHRARWTWLTVLVLLLGAGAWWFLTLGPGAYTTVPALAGATQPVAEAALRDRGLGVRTEQAFDHTVPAGQVVGTHPAAGQRVRKDGTVLLTVSKGQDLVTVPAGLVGAMQADAEAALQAAGLDAAYTDPEYSDTAPLGRVIRASQEPGTQVERRSAVTLTVSNGPAPVTVIAVTGASRADAEAELVARGLTTAVTEEFSDTVPAGQVISQSPASGTVAHRGDTVTLTVSKGRQMVQVPDVVRMGFDQAKALLESQGLVVHRDKVFAIYGNVVQQSIVAGTMVPKGSEITLRTV